MPNELTTASSRSNGMAFRLDGLLSSRLKTDSMFVQVMKELYGGFRRIGVTEICSTDLNRKEPVTGTKVQMKKSSAAAVGKGA